MVSFDVHKSVKCVPGKSDSLENKTLIIPYDYARRFSKMKRGCTVNEPHIENDGLVDTLYDLTDCYIAIAEGESVKRSTVALIYDANSQQTYYRVLKRMKNEN